MIKSFVRSNLLPIHSTMRRHQNLKPENPNHRCSSKRNALLVPKIRSRKYKKQLKAEIGKKWMEYQGINAWDGLLDPLDDNLRSEILRYGEFVEATYRSINLNPSSPNYGACKYTKKSLLTCSNIPETGYEVTRNLLATCGVDVPNLMNILPVKIPRWMLVGSSWIGYVAVCRDKQEIARLGRRDVVIAFRGTVTCLEWVENVRAGLTYLDREEEGPMVQSGFLSLYTSKSPNLKSLQEMVREEVKRIIDLYSQEPLSFTITGHSLGAALAILTANDIDATFGNHAPIMVTVISFGGPRVGDTSFRCHLEKKSRINILRVVNSDDLVTKVPGFVINYDGGNTAAAGGDDDDDEFLPWPWPWPWGWGVSSSGMLKWVRKRVKDMRWLYAEVGQELRFSSKECPYVGNVGIATCHEMKTYLQLVSSFVSSNCRFRTTAKQFLRMYRETKTS